MTANIATRSPMECAIGSLFAILLHALGIWILVFAMRSSPKVEPERPPLQTKIIEVASAAAAAASSSQPITPEMIVPPPPDIVPPKIKTEPPPKPVVEPVIHQRIQQSPPRQSPPSAAAEKSNNLAAKGQGFSTAKVGAPDQSAGARPLNGVKLAYPPDMLQENREGRVVVDCDVEPSGYTNNCAIVSARGGDPFVQEALHYVRSARYQPATRNGVPVRELQHRYFINFKLD